MTFNCLDNLRVTCWGYRRCPQWKVMSTKHCESHLCGESSWISPSHSSPVEADFRVRKNSEERGGKTVKKNKWTTHLTRCPTLIQIINEYKLVWQFNSSVAAVTQLDLSFSQYDATKNLPHQHRQSSVIAKHLHSGKIQNGGPFVEQVKVRGLLWPWAEDRIIRDGNKVPFQWKRGKTLEKLWKFQNCGILSLHWLGSKKTPNKNTEKARYSLHCKAQSAPPWLRRTHRWSLKSCSGKCNRWGWSS